MSHKESTATTKELRRRHDLHVKRVTADGLPVVAYNCPRCRGRIEQQAPTDSGETWDSVSLCVHCGEAHHYSIGAAVITPM